MKGSFSECWLLVCELLFFWKHWFRNIVLANELQIFTTFDSSSNRYSLFQEDVPEEFASHILNFISRNRIGPNGVEVSNDLTFIYLKYICNFSPFSFSLPWPNIWHFTFLRYLGLLKSGSTRHNIQVTVLALAVFRKMMSRSAYPSSLPVEEGKRFKMIMQAWTINHWFHHLVANSPISHELLCLWHHSATCRCLLYEGSCMSVCKAECIVMVSVRLLTYYTPIKQDKLFMIALSAGFDKLSGNQWKKPALRSNFQKPHKLSLQQSRDVQKPK